jgi:sugar phosphate isomerase/epimerase
MTSRITDDASLTRRNFLTGGLTAVGGVCALAAMRSSPSWAGETPAKTKMRFGLATYLWGRDWDIPTLIKNCQQAGVYGVELRTSSNYAHGVEVTLDAAQRAQVKQRFADSPLQIVSIACSERMDWPEPDRLRAAIDAAKAHLQLSHDVGCDVLRVFPNQFHRDVPRDRTIEQIARSLDELGAFAAGLGQEVSLEAHGPAGELPTMRAILDRVTQRNVRVRLNCDARDTQGEGFVANFNLVKDFLSRIIHLHDLSDPRYPYPLMVELLHQANWEGWALSERGDTVPDRVQALTAERQAWEALVENAAAARRPKPQ